MNRIFVATFLAVVYLTCCYARGDEASVAGGVVYARDIQPLLAKHCILCHGPDEAEAGLRLDVAEQAYAKLDSDMRAIVPGNADASELMSRVTTSDEFERMPPEGEPLTKDQIALLRKWINEGAEYQQHWAYQLVKEPSLPPVKSEAWVRSPIDRFVLARLEQTEISPAPEADRATLIKRLYYDLIGLPPSPDEVQAFVSDADPDAYEALVDRLLASEHFGERWGRHWLDKARYADSDGYEKDRPRPNAWRYRDWVIDAINRDMPFDQFTIEQLAGDLLSDPSPTQKLATAFHRQTLTNTEGGVDKEEFRVEATFDRTETTAAVWMSLTMTCARCHSHKYDQITQREYYQLFAFFNNANEANSEVPKNLQAMERYHQDKADHDRRVAELQEQYETAVGKLRPQIDAWEKEMTAKLAASDSPVKLDTAKAIEAKSDSGAKLTAQEDDSLLVSGKAADKDKYTIVIQAPQTPLAGIRLDVLSHDSLGSKGPGRTPHGNCVLSELRVYASGTSEFKQHTQVEFSAAEADFAQDKFPPEDALVSRDRSGWAISPQIGKDHHVTFFTAQPVDLAGKKYLQIVLDQQYGGRHTIGRFRISTMTGFDPLRALRKPVAEALRTERPKRSQDQQRLIADHIASLNPHTSDLAKELATLNKNVPKSPMMKVPVIAPAERNTQVLHRGDFLQPADAVKPEALEVIGRVQPLKSRHGDQPADRLDLARWLVHANHPLTPRVNVNQVWAHLFGRGIVATLNDFGVRGERPSHPGLLDWLAWQLPRDMGWSRKTLIKAIVSSATYRQSSNHRSELQEVDPTNRMLARQNRLRVEAEVVRDLYLSASGLLSKKVGGPSVFPPLPPGVTELSYANNFKWATSQGEDRYRRGLYTFFKRTSPHPNLISFDCPDSNTTRVERESSNTPLQALVTLNNDVFTEAAQAMVRRVLTEEDSEDKQRLTYALRLCIAREPDNAELSRFQDLLDAARNYYQANAEDATKLTQRHAVEGVPTAENAAWVATLRMVMNLDEFIVRD